MSKLDKLEVIDKETGEIIGKEVLKNIQKEESKNNIKRLYHLLEKSPEKLTIDELVILMRLANIRNTNPNSIKLDFGEDGYFTCRRDLNLVKNLHDYTKSFLWSISHLITHDGRLKYENNKIISNQQKLKAYLEISNDKWNNYIKADIENYNIIAKEKIDNKWCLLLNPIFATTDNYVLNEEVFLSFKEDILNYQDIIKYSKDGNTWDKIKRFVTDKRIYQDLEFKFNPKQFYYTSDTPLNKEGLYVLFNKGEVVYIGKSNNMENRIKNHKTKKIFDNVKCIVFEDRGLIDLYEPYLIKKYNPVYNKDLAGYIDFILPEIVL